MEPYLISENITLDIAVIREHWLQDDMMTFLSINDLHVKSHFCRGPKEHGGVAVMVNKDNPAEKIEIEGCR